MSKYKVNIQAPDKPEKREIGIWDTMTDTIKCIKNRIFKRKDIENKGIINHGLIKK